MDHFRVRGLGAPMATPSGWRGARPHSPRPMATWAVLALLLGPGGLIVLGELPNADGAILSPAQTLPLTGPTATGLASTASGQIGLVPSSFALNINGSSTVPEPQPMVAGNAMVYPDLYGVAPAGNGSVAMSERSADAPLDTVVNFTQVSARAGGVVGYPELQYGPKPWCSRSPCASAPTSPSLPLPLPVDQLESVYPIASYAVVSGGGSPLGAFDIAYDLWLTRSSTQNSANAGDVELMAWLDYNSSSILPGTPVGNFSIPTFEGTTWAQARWDAYVQNVDVSNPANHWAVVYLILHTPLSSGTVALDLTGMIGTAGDVLAAEAPNSWSTSGQNGSRAVSSLELDDIELGSEFRPSVPSGPARYVWDLFGYCLDVSPLNSPAPGLGEVDACGTLPGSSAPVGAPSTALSVFDAGVAGFSSAAMLTGLWYRGKRRSRSAPETVTCPRST